MLSLRGYYKNGQEGQALLVVVLVMVVGLTVGLSLALRTVTNLRTSSEEESSQRAFSAAEAGIERVLRTGVEIANENLDNNASIKEVNVTEIQGTSFILNGGNAISKDDGADVWLVEHNADGSIDFSTPWNGTLTVNWGDVGGDCNNAALEIITLTGATAYAAKTTRYGLDPCDGRRTLNRFSDPVAGDIVGGQTFGYKTSLPIASGYLVRLVPLYKAAAFGVSSATALPTQGKRIESTGVHGTTVRRVTLFQGFPRLSSEFFQYTLFSP